MKHICLTFIFLIAFISCSSPEPVEIPDANLAAAVREALNLDPNAPITDRNLKKLKSLSAKSRGITNLTGLEKATNLRHLNLSANQIVDITPLARLPRLRTLGLAVNQISDVSPLTGLKQLQSLWLSKNEISDISPIADLTKLIEMTLSDNQISDITPLIRLTIVTIRIKETFFVFCDRMFLL